MMQDLATAFQEAPVSPLRVAIHRRLAEVNGKLRILGMVNPANAKEEEAKWITRVIDHGSFTVPHFEYDPSRAEKNAELFSPLSNLLAVADLPTPQTREEVLLRKMLKARLDSVSDRVLLCHAFYLGREDTFVRLMQQIYGLPSPYLVSCASKILDRRPELIDPDGKLSNIHMGADHIKQLFELALDYYGLNDYKVEIKENRKQIGVSHAHGDKLGVVKIPKGRVVDGVEVIRLIDHEIGCYVLDSLNSRTLFQELPRVGQEIVSEGHAIAVEVAYDLKWYTSSAVLEQKALLALGIHLAVDVGWDFARTSEVLYRSLAEHHPEWAVDRLAQEAWKITLRIYRGMTDPAVPYAFTKDFAYLDDYLLARQYLDDGKEAWLATGACSFEEIEMLAGEYSVDRLPYNRDPNLASIIEDKLLAEF